MKLSLAMAVSTLFISGTAYASDAPDFSALSCAKVTLDYNSRQRWQPGFSQFGLDFDAWTPQAFRMLKQRAVECSNQDAQSFIAYIGHIEQSTLDTLSGMAAERERLAAVEESTARIRIEVERARHEQQAAEALKRKVQQEAEAAEQELRAVEAAKQLALAEAERAKQKQRNAEEARQREMMEADRLLEQRRSAEEAEKQALRDAAETRKRSVLQNGLKQTDTQGMRPPAEQPDSSAAKSSQTEMPDPKIMLDEDVKVFLRNNPLLNEETTRVKTEADLQALQSTFLLQEVTLLALELCAQRSNDFDGYLEEGRRRTDLIRRVYVQQLGLSAEKNRELGDLAKRLASATQVTDTLIADLDELYQTCQESMLVLSFGMNFARD